MITLKLPPPPRLPVEKKPLCTGCVYSHVIRGYEAGEELIFCGYAFPQREVLFVVRECTDFRTSKETRNIELTLTES